MTPEMALVIVLGIVSIRIDDIVSAIGIYRRVVIVCQAKAMKPRRTHYIDLRYVEPGARRYGIRARYQAHDVMYRQVFIKAPTKH